MATNDPSQPPERPSPEAASIPTRLVKRAEAARLLGMSVSSLRRREGQLVKPIIGPDGVHLFDEAEVRSVSITIQSQRIVPSLGPKPGDVAAEVFGLLEEGVEPSQIVMRLKVTPDVVQALRAQWLEMLKASRCSRCGEARLVMCRGCLVEALEAPCPTCARKCEHCGAPMGSGKVLCKLCGKWSA